MAFLLAGLLLLAAAQATTVEPVALHCYNLPMWQATGISSGFSGPWALIVDQCVNTTDVNNACTMEGFRSRSSSIDQQVDKGYVRYSFPYHRPLVYKMYANWNVRLELSGNSTVPLLLCAVSRAPAL
jgi:hypothetical protein